MKMARSKRNRPPKRVILVLGLLSLILLWPAAHYLLWISGVMPIDVPFAEMLSWFDIVSGLMPPILTVCALGWLYYMLYRGRRWARTVFLLLTIASGIYWFFEPPNTASFDGLLEIAHFIISFCGVFVFFFGAGDKWFVRTAHLTEGG